MDGQIRAKFPNQSHYPQILHQHGIHARLGNQTNVLFQAFQFAGENERVDSDIPLQTASVEQVHHLGQFIGREVFGPRGR